MQARRAPVHWRPLRPPRLPLERELSAKPTEGSNPIVAQRHQLVILSAAKDPVPRPLVGADALVSPQLLLSLGNAASQSPLVFRRSLCYP